MTFFLFVQFIYVNVSETDGFAKIGSKTNELKRKIHLTNL